MGWKALLICGIISSLVYVGIDVIAALSWDTYKFTSQIVSELMALGNPTRPLIMAPMILYNVLVTAFGIGVFGTAGRNRGLRFTGILLIVYGAISFAGLLLVPMDLIGTDWSWRDTGHVVCTIVLVLLMMLFIGFGGAASGKGFRLYSIVTIVTVLVFGAVAGMLGTQLAAHGPTPGIGIVERVNIYSSMLWVAVLAAVRLRAIS